MMSSTTTTVTAVIRSAARRRRPPPPHPVLFCRMSSSKTTDPQAESNTWCGPADPDMAAWAAPIVKDVLELYHCRVDNPATYERYTIDAVFDDPVGLIRGRNAIRVTMEALPKLFSQGEPKDVHVTYHPALIGGERNRFQGGGGTSSREQIGPQARIALVQTYEWRRDLLPGGVSPGVFLGGNTVALPTVVLLTFDEVSHLIIRHEDRWWGKDTQSTMPVLGALHGLVRRLNGKVWEAWGRKCYGPAVKKNK